MSKRTAAERRHMARVASIGCVLCHHMGLGDTPAIVHHMKFGTGASDRSSHFLTIALCPEHHVGPRMEATKFPSTSQQSRMNTICMARYTQLPSSTFFRSYFAR